MKTKLAHSCILSLSSSLFSLSHAAQESAHRFCRFHYPPIVKTVPTGISCYFTQVTPTYTDTHLYENSDGDVCQSITRVQIHLHLLLSFLSPLLQ